MVKRKNRKNSKNKPASNTFNSLSGRKGVDLDDPARDIAVSIGSGLWMDKVTGPLVILPTQESGPDRGDAGIINICIQIISDAATILRRGRRDGGSGVYNKGAAIYDETVEWAFEEDQPDRPFSLHWTCEAIEVMTGIPVSVERTRRAFLTVIEDGGPRLYRRAL